MKHYIRTFILIGLVLMTCSVTQGQDDTCQTTFKLDLRAWELVEKEGAEPDPAVLKYDSKVGLILCAKRDITQKGDDLISLRILFDDKFDAKVTGVEFEYSLISKRKRKDKRDEFDRSHIKSTRVLAVESAFRMVLLNSDQPLFAGRNIVQKELVSYPRKSKQQKELAFFAVLKKGDTLVVHDAAILFECE